MQKRGGWTVESSSEPYTSKLFTIREDRVVRPDGERSVYSTVRIKPGVLVIAVDDDGIAYLTKQYRYPLERESVEVAAGSIDEGESPEDAARRELSEELGITAERLTPLGSVYPTSSIVVLEERLFIAEGLSFGETDHEGTERIEILKVPFDDAVAMAGDGRIEAPSSCVAIFRASLHRRR